MDMLQQGKKQEKKMKKSLLLSIVMFLIAMPLLQAIEVSADNIYTELYLGQNITAVITVNNTLEKNITFEAGIAGKASEFATVEKTFMLGPFEKKDVTINIRAPKSTETGLYKGDLVISTKEKSLIIPLNIFLKRRLKDSVIFTTVTKDILHYNEDLDVNVNIDKTGKDKINVELSIKLVNRETKETILKTGDIFSTEKSVSKSIAIPITEDIPGGSYTLISEADTSNKEESCKFIAENSIIIEKPVELPSPKSNALWWIITIVILAGMLVYGTQVYRYEYVLWPLKQEEGIKTPEKQIIENSYCYLIDEKKNETGITILKNMMKQGYKGLCISREHPRHLIEKYKLEDAELKWFTTMKGYNVIEPTDVEGIFNLIDEFIDMNEKSVILLDGLHYLVVNVSMKQAVLLIQYIRDKISTTSSVFIAPLDLEVFEKKDALQFAEEMTVLDSKRKITSWKEPEPEIDVPNILFRYLKKHIKGDIGRENLKEILVEHGWKDNVIDNAFELIDEGTTPKEKKEKEKKEQKKKEVTVKEKEIERMVDDMMKELEKEVFKTGTGEKEEIKEEKKEKTPEEIKIEKIKKLRDELKRAKELMIRAIEKGHDTTKFDMQLAMISHDVEMARITGDDLHIEEIKKKLEELKKDLVRLKKENVD